MPADRRGGLWLALPAGERNVDHGGDVVDELVTGEGWSKAERCVGSSDADLEQVMVDIESGAEVDAAAERLR